MSTNKLSIATMTWARDEAEEQLLRESLQHLAALELTVFITDGGSGKPFLDFLRGFSNFNLLETKTSGVWPQVHNSLMEAYNKGSHFILYTEPDKRDFFMQALPGIVQQFFVDESLGILLATRSAAGFASFPAFQQMTETTINNCCSEITGLNIDYTYGPFIMNRLLVPSLAELKNAIGWGWRPFAFVMANKMGYDLKAIEGDYFCPVEQREDCVSERIYRMRQLSENMEAIVLAAKPH
ncbi:MAG: hypothetical protein ABIN89_03610 [Chitinophagaceae bacterium]